MWILRTGVWKLAVLIMCVGYLFFNLMHYRHKSDVLEKQLEEVVKNNSSLSTELQNTRDLYFTQRERLQALEAKKQTEVRYITKYKERIVNENNATCVGTLNDISKRLQFKNNNY